MATRIKTTVVGSYPVPSWLIGNTSRLVLRDAVMAVLKTQEMAGLDLITDGSLCASIPVTPKPTAWWITLLRVWTASASTFHFQISIVFVRIAHPDIGC